MITHEIAPLADSLWSATANSMPPCPPLVGEAEAEVAIVGGGFTGLSAALHLAEAGVDVALLEAETPGWGASGRNGGQVIPGLKEDPDAIEARFGADRGPRLVALAGGAPDLVFDLIERHAIACDAVRAGWIQPSHTDAALGVARARVEQWSRRRAPVQLLSRSEASDLLGTEAYLGGLLDARGGSLHPLNYALGLAEAAQRAGARLHGASAARAIEPERDGWRLRTDGGSLRARRVMLCTNGYTDGLMPPLARTIVPVRSVQVATEPLSDNLRRSVLPGGHVASDSRRLLLYFRLDAQGRFIMGGRGAFTEGGLRAQQRLLRDTTARLFPQIANAPWRHAWGGFVALTPDHYPHLHELRPGLVAALGYNGRGVAMATAMGRVLAQWGQGAPAEALDFPVTKAKPIPLHALRQPAVGAVVAYNRLRERWGG